MRGCIQFPQPKNRKNVKNENTQLSFNKLKGILCSSPILQNPDFSRLFIVTVDASDFAMGAVLSQGIIDKDLPIAYASRALQGAQSEYNVTEKELLAVIFAVIQFRPYIYGRKFTLVTDPITKSRCNKIEDIDSDASEEDDRNSVVVHDLRCSDISLEEEIWYHEFPVERLFVNCLRGGGNNSTESEGGVNSVENSDIIKNICQEIEDQEEIACLGTSKRKLPQNFCFNQNFTGSKGLIDRDSLKRVRINNVNDPPQKLFKTIVGKVYSRSENVEISTETLINSIEMPPIFEFDTCSGEVYAGSERLVRI